MLIAEVFESIQGEGPWSGQPSLFIRTSGCNLRCWFCDTPYTSWQPEGRPMSVPELLQSVAASSARDVVLTGGEPMLSEELAELTQGIRRLGRRITVETAGTVDQPVTCDLMAISPKLSNSVPVDAVWSSRHERTRHQPDVVRALCRRYDAILKFVIDHPDDVAEVGRYLMEFPAMSAGQVWLMPQARDAHELADKSDWIRKMAEASGYRFSPRLHIERFGNRRGV